MVRRDDSIPKRQDLVDMNQYTSVSVNQSIDPRRERRKGKSCEPPTPMVGTSGKGNQNIGKAIMALSDRFKCSWSFWFRRQSEMWTWFWATSPHRWHQQRQPSLSEKRKTRQQHKYELAECAKYKWVCLCVWSTSSPVWMETDRRDR